MQSRIVEFAKELSKHKILFGTDPLNESGLCGCARSSPASRRRALNLDEGTLGDYLGCCPATSSGPTT